jgi:hypothetical protein
MAGGCWSSSEPQPEDDSAKEITSKDSAETVDAPEAELVHKAQEMYEAQMYSLARTNLQSLKDQYPMGAYASFAEIKIADSFFYNSEYNEAAKHYEAFLKNYPGSVDSPYIELQAARSHKSSSSGSGRDREPLERALALYDGVVTHYPGSSYALAAEKERVPVIQQLAEYDRFIINFYTKQGNTAAVAAREKQFKERWGSRLTALPLAAEEQPASENNEAPLTPTPTESPLPTEDLAKEAAHTDDSIAQVKTIECHVGETTYGILELSQITAGLQAQDFDEPIAPADGVITVSDIGLTSKENTFSCFDKNDIEITGSGDLKIYTSKPVEVSIIETPPRLLLTVITPDNE